jgi:hypothetical protein
MDRLVDKPNVTLLYMVMRSIAKTIFGTNFVSFKPKKDDGRLSFGVSQQFWIYWTQSVPPTLVTLALWS